MVALPGAGPGWRARIGGASSGAKASVLLALAAAAALGGGLFVLSALGDARALVLHTFEVIGNADTLLTGLVDAETGQRGYLLTGQDQYLEPYDRAARTIGATFGRLHALVSDPVQLARLRSIEAEAAAKLSELATTIALRRQGDAAAAQALVESDRGRIVMDRLRATLTDFDNEERRLLADRVAAEASRARLATGLFGWTGLFLVLAAILVSRSILQRQRDARQRAETALSEEEAHARAILDFSPQVLWVGQPDGEVNEFAERWLDWTGLTREAARGHGWVQVVHPEDLPRGAALWQHSLATGVPYDVEYRVRMADGSYRWMRSRATPRRDPQSRRILRWYGATEDVHDRHEAEAALRTAALHQRYLLRLEEQLRLAASPREAVAAACKALGEALDCRLVAVGEIEPDGEHAQIESAWAAPGAPDVRQRYPLQNLGRTRLGPLFDGETVSVADVVTDPRTGQDSRAQDTFARLGIRATLDVPLIRNGVLTAILFAARAQPREWSESEQTFARETLDRSWDALVRARAEEALMESEARFRSTFEQAAVGMAEVELSGRWRRVNQKLLELVAYPEEELLQLTFQAITYPEDLDLDLDNVRRLIAGEISTYTMEKRYVRRDGSLLPVELTVSLVRSTTGTPLHFIGVISDISARKAAERALADALARQRAIYADAPVGLAVHGRDLRFEAINERFAAMNGLAVEAHLGRTPQEATPSSADRVEPLLRRVLETGEPVQNVEMELPTPGQPNEQIFYLASYSPIRRDNQGEVTGVSVAMLDVDARVRAEAALRNLAENLERRVEERTRALSETVAELDAFAYTVSHDLRAPLRGMEGFAQALLEDHADTLGAAGRRYAERIIGAAQRMDGLISDLLEYSRLSRSEVTLRPVSLSAALQAAMSDQQALIAQRGAAVTIPPALPEVVASAPVLRQVLSNLLGNALKFVPRGERPAITVGAERRHAVSSPEHVVELWVEDNGIGVEPEHRERIFRVFERLHADSVYPGTGIGLAIVRRGAERMGGTAGVQDRPDGQRGSRFWLRLPAGIFFGEETGSPEFPAGGGPASHETEA